jgi:hypothetical protein
MWEARAAIVAGFREMSGHDDPTDALGPAPKPGQVEAYAAFRAAWRTLGRPEVDREELECSDGQLRVRIRAYQRELPWAPRYVGNELAATRQAAAHQHQTAALRTAEADAAGAAGDQTAQARLAEEAGQAVALAHTLDQAAEQLQGLDNARAQFLAHTAMTRVKAERAEASLAERHAADADPEPVVTAEEWLAEHRISDAAEDPHRAIAETDLSAADGAADGAADDERDVDAAAGHATADLDRSTGRETSSANALDVCAVPTAGAADIRDVAAAEAAQTGEDVVRVPTPAQTAQAVTQAARSIAEIRAREAEDERQAEQERTHELGRWHDQDHTYGFDADTVHGDAFDDVEATDGGRAVLDAE